MKALLLSTTLMLLVGGAAADDTRHTKVITPDAVKWTENPAFPKGIQIATLVGDPTKAGETVVQRIVPAQLHNAAAHPSLLGGRNRHQRQHRDEQRREVREEKRPAESGINVGVPGEAPALCLDRRWGSDLAGPVYRAGRHRIRQPG